MQLDPLHYLFVDELKDLYSAETQLNRLLPEMARAATSDNLRTIFEEHVKETKEQVERLESIFELIDTKPRGKKCKAMTSLINKSKDALDQDGAGPAKDAALIAAAQQVEQFEIAEYGAIRTYAQLLGLDDAAEMLNETLQEENAVQQKLNELAKRVDDEGASRA